MHRGRLGLRQIILLTTPQLNLHQKQVSNLIHPKLMTPLHLLWPDGHKKLHNEVGSKIVPERILPLNFKPLCYFPKIFTRVTSIHKNKIRFKYLWKIVSVQCWYLSSRKWIEVINIKFEENEVTEIAC